MELSWHAGKVVQLMKIIPPGETGDDISTVHLRRRDDRLHRALVVRDLLRSKDMLPSTQQYRQ